MPKSSRASLKGPQVNVTIEYCVPCGHLERAIEVQRSLLARYVGTFGSVSLQTGTGGVFEISGDDQLVLDAARDGFDLAAITDAIDDQLTA